MDETELGHLRNYLHALRQSFTDRDDKNYLANIDRLVAVTDSELFENVVTTVYQRKEYTFKKKSVKRRRHYRIPRLASLKCTTSESSARIQALNLPDDIAVYGLYIPYPVFWPEDEEFGSKNDDVNTDRKTQSESRTRSPSPIGGHEPVPRDLEGRCRECHHKGRHLYPYIPWKSLGVRFTRKVNRSIDEESSPEEDESLYVKKIKPHSIAARSLCVGDRILAINGIMLDQQSLDQIAGSLMESGQTDLPAPNLNHLATEILKAWLNGTPPLSPEPPLPSTSACEPQGRPIGGSHRRRPPLHLTIARSNSHRNRISPRRRCPYHVSHSHKPQWNVLWSATIPADPTEAANISVPTTAVPAHLHVHSVRHVQELEEDLMEVELIDFVKSECGIGAFLRPSSKGVGAKVEKIAEGELAAIDGRLRVNDRILYVNDVCVCLMRFKDILRVYRAVADRARTTDEIQRGINFRPIRLVVSRPATGGDLQPTEASLQKLVVPRKAMLQAARDLARLAESPRVPASVVLVPTPTTLVADTAPVATAATADPLRSVPAPVSSAAAATASVEDTAAPLAASCSPTSAELPHTVPPSTTPPPPSEPPASLSSPLVLIEETEDVKHDFSKAESPDSPLVGAVAEDVGVTFWEPDSAPDTPTARAMASALIDDIMGEFQACPGKSVDLLRTDTAEDPLIEDLPLTPFQRADLRRFWRSTFRENVSIIVADYHLPPSNHSFGLTVETVIEEDEKANVREYRHYLLEVDEDGPVGTQTDLRPRDELLEINGVILYGRDSETVKTTLTSASPNGYMVCARPQIGGPFADITPFSVIEEEDEEMEEEDATQDVSSPISHLDGTDELLEANLAKLSSTALSSPTPTGETPVLDAVPDQPVRTPSPPVVLDVNTEEVPDGPKPATATDPSAAVSLPVDEQGGAPSPPPEQPASPVKDELPEIYDDELSLVITKRRAELLGIQLGPPVDQSWGFPITEITPGGPVARLINSPRSGVWPPDVQVGDEVVEVNGRRLKGLRMFSVRSILWDLVPFEGEVSLKYRQTSLPERAVPTSGVDGPPIIINPPQIKGLDQNIFMRMQAAGNSGIQSSAASNSRNHTRRSSSGQSSVSTEHNPTTRK